MQLGIESAYCAKQSLLWQKPELLAASACRSKVKHPLERHSLSSPFQPTGQLGGRTILPETSLFPAFSSLCSSLYFETGISSSFATSLLSWAV